MLKDITIHYCGPFSIQTSDPIKIEHSINCTNIYIKRGLLKELEQPVVPIEIQTVVEVSKHNL